MLDIKILRENPKEAEKLLKAKDKEVDIFKILTLDENARKIQKTVDDMKARRNNASKEIAELKKQKSACFALGNAQSQRRPDGVEVGFTNFKGSQNKAGGIFYVFSLWPPRQGV